MIFWEMESVVTSSLHEDRMIPVNLLDVYAATREFGVKVKEGNMIQVFMEYMIVDKKVKHMVVPLPKDSWKRMKGVVVNPSLVDP